MSQALQQSLASDGGLFVPESFPVRSLEQFDGLEQLPEIAHEWLQPFFADSPLEHRLGEICADTFSFPIPLKTLDERTSVLELFHGPTAAFKDVGARFLAACLQRLPDEGRLRTVLVATSGDTGSAVAAAFHGRPGFEVVILFPRGKVSARQEKQLTVWGGNVTALAVDGDFDDCQRLVKAAFADPWWQSHKRLISANSINLGRLLPQASYYVAASLWHLRRTGRKTGFVVPSGNLGNVTGALWARATGLPVGDIALATNANLPVSNFHATGDWQPLATVATLANAMDVGNPSNIERIRDLYRDHPSFAENLRVFSVTDEQILRSMREAWERHGEVVCPHTATAVSALERLPRGDWTLASTAHPAKFESIVEPALKRTVPVPAALEALLDRPSIVSHIGPTLEELRSAISH